MLLYSVHLVSESDCDSLDHVLNMGGYCVEDSTLFVCCHVGVDHNVVFLNINFCLDVSEVLCDGSLWAFYCDDS